MYNDRDYTMLGRVSRVDSDLSSYDEIRAIHN